jgi:maltooligosyltrehalose synthase
MRGDCVISLALRHTMALDSAMLEKTMLELPHGSWRNVLTETVVVGGAVSLAEIMAGWPVAVLEAVDRDAS